MKTKNKNLPKLLVIVGPTASGKTALAIDLAKKFNGEIVSADSRQLYRGMKIGADVIAGKWQRVGRRKMYVAQGVPHHLLLRYSPAQPITLTQFRHAALWHIRDIIRRGKLPIVVGGTGLYVRAIVDNLSIPAVSPNPTFRTSLDHQSTDSLFQQLQKIDPDYASRISSNNRRYIIRALEVFAATKKPFSQLQKIGPAQFDLLQLGLSRDKDQADLLIENRVADMVEHGLVSEVQRLAKRYGWDIAPMTGLGYRQLRPYFEGKATLEKCLAEIISETKQYAKRQRTWFKRDPRIIWLANTTQAITEVNRWLN